MIPRPTALLLRGLRFVAASFFALPLLHAAATPELPTRIATWLQAPLP